MTKFRVFYNDPETGLKRNCGVFTTNMVKTTKEEFIKDCNSYEGNDVTYYVEDVEEAPKE